MTGDTLLPFSLPAIKPKKVIAAFDGAENLIKLHKTQLASDRTSCRSTLANQVRLVLHTAACRLMLAVRDAIPKIQDLAKAECLRTRKRPERTVAWPRTRATSAVAWS